MYFKWPLMAKDVFVQIMVYFTIRAVTGQLVDMWLRGEIEYMN